MFVTANSDRHPSVDGLDPVPSGPIAEGRDIAIGVIEASLATLQVGSAFVASVPFIAPVAGIILQALKMRGVRPDSLHIPRVNKHAKQELKQYREEWDAVMEKLTDIASIVIDVGQSCQAHGLVEQDLPDGVRNILRSLLGCVHMHISKFRYMT